MYGTESGVYCGEHNAVMERKLKPARLYRFSAANCNNGALFIIIVYHFLILFFLISTSNNNNMNTDAQFRHSTDRRHTHAPGARPLIVVYGVYPCTSRITIINI